MTQSGQEIKVGIAGTGFIGPAHLEGLRRNNIHVAGLAEATPELAQQKPWNWDRESLFIL
jgi:predicted dehydrogenase